MYSDERYGILSTRYGSNPDRQSHTFAGLQSESKTHRLWREDKIVGGYSSAPALRNALKSHRRGHDESLDICALSSGSLTGCSRAATEQPSNAASFKAFTFLSVSTDSRSLSCEKAEELTFNSQRINFSLRSDGVLPNIGHSSATYSCSLHLKQPNCTKRRPGSDSDVDPARFIWLI